MLLIHKQGDKILKKRSFDYESAKDRGNIFMGNVEIEYGVDMGYNNIFFENCVIRAGTKIGNQNIFGVGTVIGAMPRERIKGSSDGKKITPIPKVIIGNHNLFEAYSVIQYPVETVTQIMNNVCVGSFSHISHDSIIYNEVTIASHCVIAGYCIILNFSNIGIGAMIHQRSVIGAYAMIGAGCVVVNHIAPTATVVGVPARFLHINRVGLERRGVSTKEIFATEQWLLNSCKESLLPYYLKRDYELFVLSLMSWKRNKDIIPKNN